MTHPQWFSAIDWSNPTPIEVVRLNRNLLPSKPGVYCFTSYPTAVEKDFGVLYVGKATISLRTRVPAYLKDPERMKIGPTRSTRSEWNTALNHAGAALLLIEIQAKYRPEGVGKTFVWLRWAQVDDPTPLEDQLIQYLKPKFNSVGVRR